MEAAFKESSFVEKHVCPGESSARGTFLRQQCADEQSTPDGRVTWTSLCPSYFFYSLLPTMDFSTILHQ